MVNNLLIAGSGASIFDVNAISKSLGKPTFISNSDINADINIDWENLNKLEINKSPTYKILVLLGGIWSPGRMKSIDSYLLSELLNINAFKQVELIKILKKKKYLDNKSAVIFISSQSAITTDFTAPEYSYSKVVAEVMIRDICKLLKINKLDIIRPSFIEGSNMLNKSTKHFGNNLQRKTISKTEFMESLNDKIHEIFYS